MRILTFASLFPNKVMPSHGIFIYQRMAHVAKRPGNEVVVVAPIPYFPSWLPLNRWKAESKVPRQETIGSLTVYHPRYFLVPKISMPLHGLLILLGVWRLVRKLHRERPFDCIDSHFVYPDGFAAALLGKMLGIPVFISARGTDINLYPSFKLIRPLIRWTIRNSAGAIAVSSSLRDVMLELGAKPEKAVVIGNGIDLERFHPIEPATARRQLRIPEDAKVIVSVGGLIPRKGFHFLIPALANVLARFPAARLYILGEGEYRQHLEEMIRQLGLQDRVALVGRVANEQLKFWYSAADLSCLVSSREGWANVLQESLACGTPVLATRVWGAPEVITSPDLGLLVEQTVPAVSEGLSQALETRWDRSAIASHASRRTWDVVACEVEEFLKSGASVGRAEARG